MIPYSSIYNRKVLCVTKNDHFAQRSQIKFFMVFHGSGWVFMMFHGFRLVFHGSWSVFMVPGRFSWFFIVFHGSRSDFIFFNGSRSVFMVPGRFSWFFMVQGCFFHIENTIKLYSGLVIQSRPCRP